MAGYLFDRKEPCSDSGTALFEHPYDELIIDESERAEKVKECQIEGLHVRAHLTLDENGEIEKYVICESRFPCPHKGNEKGHSVCSFFNIEQALYAERRRDCIKGSSEP